MERYEFHWTRFDSHSKSRAHATKQKKTTHDKMHELAQKFQWRLNEAQFLMDAVVEAEIVMLHCFFLILFLKCFCTQNKKLIIAILRIVFNCEFA